MSKEFDTTLSAVINLAAAAAEPQGPSAARARGRRRAARKHIMVSALSLALVATGAGAGVALTTGDHPKGSAPATVVTGPSTTATPARPSPQPSQPAGPPHADAPTLSLDLPIAFAAGAANRFAFTAVNPGAARNVTVTLDLGNPTSGAPGATQPNEQAVLERQDPSSGSWIQVPVAFSSADRHDTATYQMNLPARASATETLRLTPVGTQNATIGVSLSGSTFTTVSQSRTVALTAPSLTGAGPASVKPGSTPEFDFTLTNSNSADYTGIQLYLTAYGSTAGCANSPFTGAQWTDGGAWQTTSLPGAGWPMLGTVSLNAGQSKHIRVRIAVPATLPSCLAKGQVAMIAQTQGAQAAIGNSQPNSTARPGFSVRGDAPFFSIS